MSNLPLNGKQANVVVAGSVITFLALVAVVLLSWWQIEAQIDQHVDQKLAPVAQQVEDLKGSVDKLEGQVNDLNGQQREMIGELRHLSRGLGVPPRPPDGR